MATGHRPAGGLHSRNVKHTTAPKVEPRAHARNPATVSQYGQMQGDHVTSHGGGKTSYRGDPDFTRKGYSPPVGPTSFNKTGPGGGRTIYHCGSQGQTGSGGAEKPAGRDILSGYGPDKSGS